MKWTLLSMIGLAVFLVSCSGPDFSEKIYTFAEGFAELQEIDQQFNTSFHDERLNVTMVAPENIDPLIEAIKEFKAKVEQTQNNEDRAALLDFASARVFMLLSQKSFQKAQDIGDIGLVSDKAGFSCSETPYILQTAAYLNQSYNNAIKARDGLDRILFEYQKVPNVRALIGVNKQKAWFYYSPLDDIKNKVRNNHRVIDGFCKKTVVKK